ncbi:MAG: hypothetical protein VYD57_12870 [Pseudomonadota bacterium]|nr:hypothetical protein [Pseudomonadota bacterium]
MRQLPLDLPPIESLSRDDLVVTRSNQMAVEAIDQWPHWRHNVLLIVGPEGAGKSHLAQIWADAAGATMVCPHDAGQIAGDDGFRAVIDDIDRTDLSDEELFGIVNVARLGRGWLLATARTPPVEWRGRLKDLVSRLSAAAFARLDPPDDALLSALLVKLFADRQLAVDPQTVDYLATRIERSAGAARKVVAGLDRAALSEKRRITRPLVRQVLGIGEGQT